MSPRRTWLLVLALAAAFATVKLSGLPLSRAVQSFGGAAIIALATGADEYWRRRRPK